MHNPSILRTGQIMVLTAAAIAAGCGGDDEREPVGTTSSALGSVVDIQAFVVHNLTCKTNRITWRRPTSAAIACGQIQKYNVYRNDLLVSTLAGPGGAPINDAGCPTVTYTAPGDSGMEWDQVDEQSTHQYKVRVVDTANVEHDTTAQYTVSSAACPAAPYTASINMTLVTFADVVNAGCATYPCVVASPPGAPFTIAKAQTDLYATGGTSDRPPIAWVLQQNAPDKTVGVTGEVAGWVVLPPRSTYCASPYNLAQCGGAHSAMVAAAIGARGPMTTPRIDAFHIHGTDSGPYATSSPVATAGEIREFSKIQSGLFTETHFEHEAGHLGLYDDVSAKLGAHSFSLRCPGGLTIGPDLRDLSKDANGTPGACMAVDYGDTMCTMGNQYRYFSGYQRWRLGLIDVSNVYTVWPAATVSTIWLEHLNAPSSPTSTRMKLLRVPLDSNVGDTAYLLEYRGGSAWRELDYTANCPGGFCSGASAPQGLALPQGVYLRLRVRNPVDLGPSNPEAPGVPFSPNGSVQSLALSKEVSPGSFAPLYLTPGNDTFCDPYRNIRIRLLAYTTVGGVDTAMIEVTRGATCP